MKFVLLAVCWLVTQNAPAQAQDKLYYKSTNSLVGQWDVFVIIKGDTAFSQGLSEIHGALQVGLPETDTMYRKNDSVYIGRRYMLISDNEQLFFVYRKKPKNRMALLLISGNEELTRLWNRRNNLLVYLETSDKYEAKRRKLPKKSDGLKLAYEQLKQLEIKVDSLGQDEFRVEVGKFEKQYLGK